jgi:protein TonB
MRQQPFLSMPIQHRAAVLGLVLAWHMALAWLLGRTQEATPPTLDVAPITVALLQAATSMPAEKKAPSATMSKAPAPASPATPAPQPLLPPQTPVAAPVTPSASVATPAPAPAVATSASTAPSSAASTTPTASSRTGSAGAASTRDSAATLVSGSCAKPQYPMASRRLEEEGTVTLRFRVEANGHVSQSEVQNSSGFTRLDEAARAALSRCSFSPALAQGQAIASWATIRYTWRLE